MIRPVTALCGLLALGSGFYLYHAKHEVELIDRHIDQIATATSVLRADSRRLLDEWIRLGEPEQLHKYSDQYLGLKTINPGQFVRLTDLANRLPMPRTAPIDAPDDGVSREEAGTPRDSVGSGDMEVADGEELPVPPIPPALMATVASSASLSVTAPSPAGQASIVQPATSPPLAKTAAEPRGDEPHAVASRSGAIRVPEAHVAEDGRAGALKPLSARSMEPRPGTGSGPLVGQYAGQQNLPMSARNGGLLNSARDGLLNPSRGEPLNPQPGGVLNPQAGGVPTAQSAGLPALQPVGSPNFQAVGLRSPQSVGPPNTQPIGSLNPRPGPLNRQAGGPTMAQPGAPPNFQADGQSQVQSFALPPLTVVNKAGDSHGPDSEANGLRRNVRATQLQPPDPRAPEYQSTGQGQSYGQPPGPPLGPPALPLGQPPGQSPGPPPRQVSVQPPAQMQAPPAGSLLGMSRGAVPLPLPAPTPVSATWTGR